MLARVSGTPGSYAVSSFSVGSSSNGAAVDGAGNIWLANGATSTFNGVVSGSISVFSSSGVNLIQPNGIVKSAASNALKTNLITGLGPAWNVAIDPSGNVWTSNSNPYFGITASPAYIPSSITEIVGAAVPVVTPFATGLANGTLATKP
jgi:hypothetical protein